MRQGRHSKPGYAFKAARRLSKQAGLGSSAQTYSACLRSRLLMLPIPAPTSRTRRPQ